MQHDGGVSDWRERDDDDDVDLDTDPQFKSVLQAAEKGEISELTLLLDRDSSLVNCRDSDGYTPLHRASYNGHLEVAKLLIDRGANVKSKTNNGWTPLHSASKWAHCQLASLLLDNGAKADCVTDNGSTPLHLACEQKTKAIIEMLLYHPNSDLSAKNDVGDTAFDIARRSGPFYKLFKNVRAENMNFKFN
ncbi:Ankyrin repeat domain-containing protein 49 [Halotydeus destructor]|nr:Ankyrin repeat domain-containing protein 49 [Halotydeus destructor]